MSGISGDDTAVDDETARNARRYAFIRDAFNDMKLSRSERFLECLGIDGDALLPLDLLLDPLLEQPPAG